MCCLKEWDAQKNIVQVDTPQQKQSRCPNWDGSPLNGGGFRFQRDSLSHGSQGREWQGGCEDIRTGTKIAIFGHRSALGNIGVKGDWSRINDFVCSKRNTTLRNNPTQPIYSKTSSHTKAICETLKTLLLPRDLFSTSLSLSFLYPVPLSVWWNSFAQRASVFDPFCWIIIYHTFSLTAFLTFPFATLFTTSKCIQRSARRLSRRFFSFKMCSPFSHSRSSFPSAIQTFTGKYRHREKERRDRERERERERERKKKKKTNFLAFSRQWLSKKPPLAHRSWLHSFPNANQMWSTNVWQRFCFFLQRKTNVGQKCSLLAIRARWYKNKFRFIPEFQTFPHGGWDGTVWFRVIAMLLFGVGRVLWNIGIESGLWKATDEMWQLHFQLRLPSESFFIHMHTGSSSRARPQFSALQAPVRLWQIYVWSITKHTSARAWAVLFVYLLYVFKSPYQILLIIEPRSFDIQAFQASCCTAFL